MKKVLYRSLLVGFLGAALNAQAQLSFGPRVGFNMANVSYDVKQGEKPDTKMLAGAQFGVMLNARFGKMAIQPAVLFSQKGFQTDYTSKYTTQDTVFGKGTFLHTEHGETPTKEKYRLNYVEIPVNLVFTSGETQGFQVVAGPYVGFGLSGKYTADATTTTTTTSDVFLDQRGGGGSQTSTETISVPGVDKDIKFKGDVKPDDDIKYHYVNTPDFGLNFGIGYLKNHFQVQALYGLGLRNILPKYDGKAPDDTVKNRVIQLTLGYLFNADGSD